MNRFEQLREELTKIRQEAAERMAAQKAREDQAAIDRLHQRNKEKELAERAESNWEGIKRQSAAIFQDLNRNILGGSGQITHQRRKTPRHLHSRHTTYEYEPTTYYHLCESEIEEVALEINNVGKIFVFRIISFAKGDHYSDPESAREWPKRMNRGLVKASGTKVALIGHSTHQSTVPCFDHISQSLALVDEEWNPDNHYNSERETKKGSLDRETLLGIIHWGLILPHFSETEGINALREIIEEEFLTLHRKSLLK